MLDTRAKEAYKDIHLSRDLREEIRSCREQQHASAVRYRRMATAFASLALIVSVTALTIPRSDSWILLAGESVTRRGVTVSAETVAYQSDVMRAFALIDENLGEPGQTATNCAPLTVQLGGDVCIIVTGGMLLLPDPDGIPTYAGQSGVVADGASFYWALPDSDIPSPLTAYISDFEGNTLLTLTAAYEAESDAWQISAAKTKKS